MDPNLSLQNSCRQGSDLILSLYWLNDELKCSKSAICSLQAPYILMSDILVTERSKDRFSVDLMAIVRNALSYSEQRMAGND